jgi:hypothetical protein
VPAILNGLLDDRFVLDSHHQQKKEKRRVSRARFIYMASQFERIEEILKRGAGILLYSSRRRTFHRFLFDAELIPQRC